MISVYDYIIVGSSGFIGKHLVKFLNKKKYKIFKVDRNKGDLSKKKLWKKLPKGKVLINLASKIFSNNKDEQIKTNFNIALNSLEYCKKQKAKMIFISTYLYGKPKKIPTSEKAKITYSNEYGLSKKMSEDLCKFYHEKYNVKTLILRPFNIYGKNQNTNFLIPKILSQISKKKITIQSNCFGRDFLHVNDFVKAIEKLSKYDFDFNILNIGSGKMQTFKIIMSIINKILKKKLKVNVINKNKNSKDFNTKANISKIKKIIDWKPEVSFNEGIKKLINEYSNRRS